MSILAVILAMWIAATSAALSQSFINLDFEAARITGYTPPSINVPIGSALPGWDAYFFSSTVSNQVTQVWYDGISLGGYGISVNDTNSWLGFTPFQGKFSAFLFGGSLNVSAMITQTGLVPAGEKTILMDVSTFYNFRVTVGGQNLNMVPLQIYPNYTVYGGDISGFAGQVVTLSITAPPTGLPNAVVLDDIQFSTQPIPEPTGEALLFLGVCIRGLFPRRLASSCTIK